MRKIVCILLHAMLIFIFLILTSFLTHMAIITINTVLSAYLIILMNTVKMKESVEMILNTTQLTTDTT